MDIDDYDKILKDYKLIRRLGRGGMGEVFLAKDILLGRKVAVKFLNAQSKTDDNVIQKRFQNEAKILASLDHPNIVRIFNFGVQDDTNFIVMEYVEGKTLSEVISQGAIRPAQALKILRRLVRGIREAHERAIIHRDIKPANIILTTKKDIKIVDFGISKSFTQEDQNYTKADHFIGTINYIAPEILLGGSPSMMSDIFSIGVIFYEMVTQKNPLKGENQFETIEKIKNAHLVLPPDIQSQLPVAFATIFNKMVARDPHNRYQSSDSLYTQLKGLVAARSIIEPSPTLSAEQDIQPSAIHKAPKDEIEFELLQDDESISGAVKAEPEDHDRLGKSAVERPFSGTETSPSASEPERATAKTPIETKPRRERKVRRGLSPLTILCTVISGLYFGHQRLPQLLEQINQAQSQQQVALSEPKPIESEPSRSEPRLPASKPPTLVVAAAKTPKPVLEFPEPGSVFSYELKLYNQKSGRVKKTDHYTLKVGQARKGVVRSSVQYKNGRRGLLEARPNGFIPPMKMTQATGQTQVRKVTGRYNAIYPLEVGKSMKFSELVIGQGSSFESRDYNCVVTGTKDHVVKVSALQAYRVTCTQLAAKNPRTIVTDYSAQLRQVIRRETKYYERGQSYVEVLELKDYKIR